MSIFTKAELAYLQDRKLARVATVGADGTPHVTPVGMWTLDPQTDVIEITGHDFEATKKFKDVLRTGRAAVVIDDVLPPWQPRAIEIRGDAEAVAEPEPKIRVHPRRVVSWGIDGENGTHARSV